MTTQAVDVVTAEMVSDAVLVRRATIGYEEDQMRAALIASGLPAEVARLQNIVERAEQAARNTGFHNWANNPAVVINAQADELRKANEIGDNLRAELSRLRGELSSKKEQFDALRKAVFDECTMADKERIQSRYTVLVQIEKDQQP